MDHRTVKYAVQEDTPGRWCWTILPGNRQVHGTDGYRTRELAVSACIHEINNGIERTNRYALRGLG